MIRVLFVCTGNICRSPMAEALMREKIKAAGLTDQIEVDSAGMISYHSGELADPRTRATLQEHGITFTGTARQVADADYDTFNYLIGMTREHVDELNYRKGNSKAQVLLFLDLAPDVSLQDVPDPYYDNNFEKVYELVDKGCVGLLELLKKQLSGQL